VGAARRGGEILERTVIPEASAIRLAEASLYILQTEIPESLKCGAFVGEVRLYTIHAIKPD
jgi:hypothetical protein